jgi:hypothetical protein
MKAAFSGLAMLLVATLPAGAGEVDRHEAAIKEMLGNIDKIVAGLATVKDEASAKAAVGGLKQLAKDWERIRKKAEDLPPPTPKEREALIKKFKAPLETVQKKLAAEVRRVRTVPGGAEAVKTISAVLAGKAKEKKD